MEASKISWTDNTFNSHMGCLKISDACQFCYAEQLVVNRMRLPVWGPAKTTDRKRTSAANWRKPILWNRRACKTGKREKVFCASLADVFEDHPQLPPIREDLWKLIDQCPFLDWQLLTKRPENVNSMVPKSWLTNWPKHVWMGTTVENQECANKRIQWLVEIPAPVRFLSCEPLLGPIDLTRVDHRSFSTGLETWFNALTGQFHSNSTTPMQYRGISWVIAGGESGSGFRTMQMEWLEQLMKQCGDAGVARFVKQDSGPRSGMRGRINDELWSYKQFPKVAI